VYAGAFGKPRVPAFFKDTDNKEKRETKFPEKGKNKWQDEYVFRSLKRTT
jgi:hypothetical protein